MYRVGATNEGLAGHRTSYFIFTVANLQYEHKAISSVFSCDGHSLAVDSRVWAIRIRRLFQTVKQGSVHFMASRELAIIVHSYNDQAAVRYGVGPHRDVVTKFFRVNAGRLPLQPSILGDFCKQTVVDRLIDLTGREQCVMLWKWDT